MAIIKNNDKGFYSAAYNVKPQFDSDSQNDIIFRIFKMSYVNGDRIRNLRKLFSGEFPKSFDAVFLDLQ